MSVDEVWEPVAWHPERYQVSNLGRVRSTAVIGTVKSGAPARILAPAKRRGYPFVTLWRGGEQRMFSVHGLVAEAFIGPRPDGQQVNHRDGARDNPAAENLEYCSAKENYRHALDVLGHKPSHGEKHWMAKLNADIVREMRYRRADGETVKELMAAYGLTVSHVSLITRGKMWAHIVPRTYLDVRA